MDERMLMKKAKGLKSLFGLALMVSVLLPTAGRSAEMKPPGSGPLDGKTFAVETGDKGKGGSDKDTLDFRNGRFHSAGCDKYGFGDGAYTAAEKDGKVSFEAETTSPSKGKISWKGTVQGDKIEVSYSWLDSPHWYKPNPKPVEKWARGELKKP